MDREQAIKIVKDCKEKSFKRTLYTLDEYYEAVDMAIKALEQEPDAIHNEREQAYMKGYEDASKRFRTEPCEDVISRQAVDTLVDELARAISYERCYVFRGRSPETIMQDILDLPSVSTEKTGRWIEQEGYDGDTYYDCSECGESFCLIDGTPTDNLYNYCPNCGSRMIEPQESEDAE